MATIYCLDSGLRTKRLKTDKEMFESSPVMATCYKCGEEIEFYHNGFNAVPIHLSGSCSASGGSYGYGSGSDWVERKTELGQSFVFGWVEYPSYVNPNAHCPVCGAEVYFYQSPYGGRVLFDELGPPWPKHPCTSSDDSTVRRTVRDFKLEELFPASAEQMEPNSEPESSEPKDTFPISEAKPNREIPEWRKAGWSPRLLSKAEPSGGGIVIAGKELLEDSKTVEHKLTQVEIQDTFDEARGGLIFSSSLTMNPNRLISALTENIVFIRRVSGMIYALSTISISLDGGLAHFIFRMKSS
jgi:hypothetical protein